MIFGVEVWYNVATYLGLLGSLLDVAGLEHAVELEASILIDWASYRYSELVS